MSNKHIARLTTSVHIQSVIAMLFFIVSFIIFVPQTFQLGYGPSILKITKLDNQTLLLNATGNLDETLQGHDQIKSIEANKVHIWCLLKGSVKNLKNLQSAIFNSNIMSFIERGAFSDLPSLQSLKITKNHINFIKNEVFNGLVVEELDLSYNSVVVIEENAFAHMKNLEVLSLNNNRLQKWDPQWVQNSFNVRVLNLGKNSIKKLENDSFKYLKKLEVIDLSKNGLKYIQVDAFAGSFQLVDLKLEQNALEYINPDTIIGNKDTRKDKRGTQLDLQENPGLDCLDEKFIKNLKSVNKLNLNGCSLSLTNVNFIVEWGRKNGVEVILRNKNGSSGFLDSGRLDDVKKCKDLSKKWWGQ